MTDTRDELLQQAAHEKRLREDLDYAIQYRKETIYGDLREFEDFVEGHQMFEQVAREFLRALCESKMASREMLEPSLFSKNGFAENEIAHRNQHTKLSQGVVLEAIARIKFEFDSKIENIVRAE